MNVQKTMRRLQAALCTKGQRVRINQFQHYSERKGKMVTKYLLGIETKVEDKVRNTIVLETYQPSEVIKTLAEMLGGGDG